MKHQIEPGTTVVATDGAVGVVEAVVVDPATGEPAELVVRTHAGQRVAVPFALVDADSTARQVRLGVTADAVSAGVTEGEALPAIGDHLVVPVREEVLVPTTRPVTIGSVRVEKRIETAPAEATVEVERDEVAIERIAVGRSIDSIPAPRHEGETLVIPVVEEVLVAEKRLVLKEEIRVTRRKVAEPVTIRDTVRREVVTITESTVPAAGGARGRADDAGGVVTDAESGAPPA